MWIPQTLYRREGWMLPLIIYFCQEYVFVAKQEYVQERNLLTFLFTIQCEKIGIDAFDALTIHLREVNILLKERIDCRQQVIYISDSITLHHDPVPETMGHFPLHSCLEVL